MRYPQLILRENDGALTRTLRPFATEHKWILREPKRLNLTFRLLAAGHPSVLLLKVGQNLVREMTLVERSSRLFPEIPVVVVSDVESLPLSSLAWHLGASFVLMPPQTYDQLLPLVAGLMEQASKQGWVGPSTGQAIATLSN